VETLQAQVQSLEGVAEKREAASASLQEKINSLTSDLQAKVCIDGLTDADNLIDRKTRKTNF